MKQVLEKIGDVWELIILVPIAIIALVQFVLIITLNFMTIVDRISFCVEWIWDKLTTPKEERKLARQKMTIEREKKQMNREELEKHLSRNCKIFYSLTQALKGFYNLGWTMVCIVLFFIVKLIVGVMFIVFTPIPPYSFFRPFYFIGKFYIIGNLLLAIVDIIGDIKALSGRYE